MKNSLKSLLTAVFLLGAFTILFGIVAFLKPSLGDEKQVLYLRFSNINKINVGTRVLFAGKAIGEVASIEEIQDARETQPSDSLGRLFFYQLTLKIDSNVKVYDTDLITLQTSGLLGEKSVSIVPKAAAPGTVPKLITQDTPIYAASIDPIEHGFTRMSEAGEQLYETTNLLKNWFTSHHSLITESLSSTAATMKGMHLLTQSIQDQNFIPQIQIGLNYLNGSLKTLNHAVSEVQNQTPSFSSFYTRLNKVLNLLESNCQHLGKGTLGKLMQQDDLYFHFMTLTNRMNTLFGYINRYGFLFHMNKSWQKANLKPLIKGRVLENPTAFNNYCTTELHTINETLDRLALLIDKAKQEKGVEWIQYPSFRNHLHDLLNQCQEVSNNLRFCNETLLREQDTP